MEEVKEKECYSEHTANHGPKSRTGSVTGDLGLVSKYCKYSNTPMELAQLLLDSCYLTAVT